MAKRMVANTTRRTQGRGGLLLDLVCAFVLQSFCAFTVILNRKRCSDFLKRCQCLKRWQRFKKSENYFKLYINTCVIIAVFKIIINKF
jgi:hypothetical protein